MASPGRKQSQDVFASPVTSPRTSQQPFTSFETPTRAQSYARPHNAVRTSTAGSITSLGTAPDTRNAVVESGPNAISTLLQPPIVRTGLSPHSSASPGGFKVPTQRDIAPVALTNIAHVDAKAFHPYLSQVGSLYEAFQRAKNETEGGENALFHRDKKQRSEDWESVLNDKLQRPGHLRRDSVVSIAASPTDGPQLRRRSSAQKRQGTTPLSTVPSVYNEEDFHLENPRTFDIVSERSEIVRDPNTAPSGRKSLATNAILQEKLSWYLDTVEVHLISSISTASKSFFSALGSLHELHAEAEDSILRIQKLRKDLAKLDKEMAVDGLKVVNLKQRRDNVRRLAGAILQLDDIVRAFRQCEAMVQDGDYDGVFDNIDAVERLVSGTIPREGYVPQDLRRVKALGGAVESLSELKSQVGRGFEKRFHDTLMGDMRHHVSQTDSTVTLQRWGATFNRQKTPSRRAPSVMASYMTIAPEFRTDLEQEMKGLTRASFTTPAVTTFRALVLREMKSMIRRQLPSASDDDAVSTISASTHGGRSKSAQERSLTLARNIRALDNGDWCQTLERVYTSISESLRRLNVQVKILLDITSGIEKPSSAGDLKPARAALTSENDAHSPSRGRQRSVSIMAEMQQTLDLSSLLGEAVDAAQTQMTRVLRIRTEQNKSMTIHEFIRYFTLNRLFADECEAISGRSGTALKSTVDMQIKDYVAQFGADQLRKLVDSMDADRWEPRDFSEEASGRLGRLIDASTGDIATWLQSSQIWQTPVDQGEANGVAAHGASSGKEKIRGAVIDEQKFILPESSFALLRAIEQFEMLTSGIPGAGQEIALSQLECLKMFDSRSRQLILSAGATRSAGLKSITTKHLTMSSQALSFTIALVPYIREFFRRHVPQAAATQSMTDFDKIKLRLLEHQDSINEKFVDIMSNVAARHIRSMQTVDWDEAAADSAVSVSPYMEILVKDTSTLQRTLAKYLSEANVTSIMARVFKSYERQWEAAFKGVELKSSKAKLRLLADAHFFESRIGSLEGAGALGSHIVQVVHAREPIQDATDKPPADEESSSASADPKEPAGKPSVPASD